MMLHTPSAPFEPVSLRGSYTTVETEGKILVLCTGNPGLLPNFNEYTLTEGRSLQAGIYNFTNDYNSETGILNLNKCFITVYDPDKTYADFYMFTHMPTNLKFTVDSLGIISELTIYPGNGLIYWGRIDYPDLTLDSNSDLIPDFLDQSVNGSLPRFLSSYAVADGPQGIKVVLLSTNDEIQTSNGLTLFVRG